MLITLYVGYGGRAFEETVGRFKLLMEAVSLVTGGYTNMYGQVGYMGKDGYTIDPIRRIEFLIQEEDPFDVDVEVIAAIDTLVDSLKKLFEQDSILKTIQYNVSQELV